MARGWNGACSRRPRSGCPRARFAGVLLVTCAVACGDPTHTKADVDAAGDASEPETTIPAWTVAIDASRTTGNAPLSVAFESVISGLDPARLAVEWRIDDVAVGSDPTLAYTFYRAGASTVVLHTTYHTETGAVLFQDASVVIRIRACADLRFDRVSIAEPTDVPPGGVFQLKQGTLHNDGDLVEDAFAVGLGLSLDPIWDPATDILLAAASAADIPGMPAGFFGESTLDLADRTFAVPTDVPTGAYYAFLVADPGEVVNECQEANNALLSTNTVTVDPEAGKRPDLVIEALDVPDGLVVKQGDILSYSFKLRNQGEADATQFRHAFWLSRDQELSPETDWPIELATEQTARVQSMQAGLVLGFLKSYRIPEDLPTGSWWIIGAVDVSETVGESDEDNNIAVSGHPLEMQFVEPQCYDLALTEFRLAPTQTYWGGTVKLIATVENTGTLASPDDWGLRAYLSLQPTLNPANATSLGQWMFASVPAGGQRDIEILIPVSSDLPVLPYYAGAIVDPFGALPECEEGNNAALADEPLQINALASVDVSISNFVYHPTAVAAGGTVKVEYDVGNGGTSNATSFNVGIVLSSDATITRQGIKTRLDVVVDSLTIDSLAPGESVHVLRDVVIPRELDHAVAAYTVGALADIEGYLTADTEPDNDLMIAPDPLAVTGADGGCFPDAFEPSDSLAAARPLVAGSYPDLWSCGDADWYGVDVPGGQSLLVDVEAAAIDAFPPAPSELVVEIADPSGRIVTRQVTGPHYAARAYLVTDGGRWRVRVAGAGAADRARYSVSIAVMAPGAGVDLACFDGTVAPAESYPGGRLALAWGEVALGLTEAPARTSRAWLSRDDTLNRLSDKPLGELAMARLAGASKVAATAVVTIPEATLGGDWRVLMETDADDDAIETDETNNVAVLGLVFLDAAKTCRDDALEPNDEPAIASLLVAPVTVNDAVVCPSIDDWYAIDLNEGQSAHLTLAYPYDSLKGKLTLELWDPDLQAVVTTGTSANAVQLDLPWAWRGGRWFMRVTSGAATYSYDLSVSAGPGDLDQKCTPDPYEPNNARTAAAGIGCNAVTAILCAGDVDWWVVPVQAGRYFKAKKSQAYALKLSLFASASDTATDTTQWDDNVSFTPSSDGVVYLKVESNAGASTADPTTYTLETTGVRGADVGVTAFTSSFAAAVQGEDIGVDFALVNSCSDAAPGFATEVLLSLDDAPDATDVVLDRTVFAGLASGAGATVNEKVAIPLSTLPGLYWVLVWVDADEVLGEANETDNYLALPLKVTAPCEADVLEPNDLRAEASALPLPGAAADLAICAGDVDWFAVDAEAGDIVTIQAIFAHADGDLDLRVYDPLVSQTLPIATSTSTDDDEEAVITVPLATTLYVRVSGFGADGAPYDLAIDVR